MKKPLRNLALFLFLLLSTILLRCSDTPSNDYILNLISESLPDAYDAEILKIGDYDSKQNRLTVRVKYVWAPNEFYREECIADFALVKDVGCNEWKLLPSRAIVSKRQLS